MRRRLQRYLPVVLLALLVQIIAPVAACWAAASVISDPIGAAEICHSDPAAPTTQGDAGSLPGQHGTCWICFAAQASASFDAPRPLAFALPYRHAAQVAWGDHAPQLSALPARSHAQARAPPTLS